MLQTKNLVILFGLFSGDGYLYHDKKTRHYKVEFFLNSVRDLDIKQYLESILRKFNLNIFNMKDKRSNTLKIFFNSISMFYIIKEEKNLILERIDKDYLIGFISGFIDAEGSTHKGCGISVSQKNKKFLDLIIKILSEYNIHTKLTFKENNWKGGYIWKLYISTTFKNIPHNSVKVNRVYGCENTRCSS